MILYQKFSKPDSSFHVFLKQKNIYFFMSVVKGKNIVYTCIFVFTQMSFSDALYLNTNKSFVFLRNIILKKNNDILNPISQKALFEMDWRSIRPTDWRKIFPTANCEAPLYDVCIKKADICTDNLVNIFLFTINVFLLKNIR